jgi:hypothetical protein
MCRHVWMIDVTRYGVDGYVQFQIAFDTAVIVGEATELSEGYRW